MLSRRWGLPVGRVEFPAVPVLVDRMGEIERIQRALETAGMVESSLLLVRGEAGTGKTRLIQEAAAEAERRGRSVVSGAARAESAAPYHLWSAPFDRLGIRYVLDEAPPPRLMGLYLLSSKGRLLVAVERDPDGKSSERVNATTLEPDPIGSAKLPLGGGLSVFNGDDHRLLVLERSEVRLCATVEGHEDEVFLEALRKLVGEVEVSADGGASPTAQSFKCLLDSGKYDGIDYGKGDPKLRQSRLFQNASLGLARHAELHPLLIVLDDLQWADPSSLALLGYLARNLRRSDVLLFGTYRVEEGSIRPHLQEALDRMAREGLLAELSIGGLSRRDLGLLAESFIGPHGLAESFLDLLWDETAGNPLIVREVLRRLVEDNAIQDHGASRKLVVPLAELSIPRRVREAVRARLERVPKQDRRLLEAAAACGTRFTAAMVARLVGEPEGTVVNGFGSIAGVHGFLRGGAPDFTFDHPAVQEVLYEGMGDDVRRVYHREAADWLELAGGPAEDVAEHLYRARDDRAVERLLQVARSAKERYGNAEAIRFYKEALELGQGSDQSVELLEGLGSVYELVGAYDTALECYRKALELAGEKERAAEILTKAARAHFSKSDYEKCLEACEQALGLVGGAWSKEEALALHQIGAVHRARGDFDAALESFGRSLAIQERIGDQDGIARSLNSIGAVHGSKGDIDAALEAFGRSLAIQETIGDQRGIARSLNSIGAAHAYRGDYDAALESFGRSLAIQDRIGDQDGIARSLGNIGSVQEGRGNVDAALEYHGRSLAIQETIGDLRGIASSLNSIGSVHRNRGDYDVALEYSGRSLAIRERIGDLPGIASSLSNIGVVQESRANFEAALECHGRSLAIRERIGDQHGIARSLSNIGVVHAYRGDYETALDYFGRSMAIREKLGDQDGIAGSLSNIAVVHAYRGDYETALDYFGRSMAIREKLGDRMGVAELFRKIGSMHAETGNPQVAAEYLRKALELPSGLADYELYAKTRYALSMVELRGGNLERAREYSEIAISTSEKIGLKGTIAAATRVLGMIHRERQSWPESIENFEKSLQIGSETGLRLEEAKSEYEFGLMWKAHGDRTKARNHFTTAATLFKKLGLEREYQKAFNEAGSPRRG